MRKPTPAKPGRPTTIAGASSATWFFAIQICCFTARVMSPRANSFTTGIACFALTLALASLYEGIRCFRRGDRMQAVQSGVMGSLALLFWSSQLILAYMRIAS